MKLCLFKVTKLDACIRPLFANSIVTTYFIFNIIHWSSSKRKLNISKLNKYNTIQLLSLNNLTVKLLYTSWEYCDDQLSSAPVQFHGHWPFSVPYQPPYYEWPISSLSLSTPHPIVVTIVLLSYLIVIGQLTCSSNPFFISANCCFRSANSASAFSINCIR